MFSYLDKNIIFLFHRPLSEKWFSETINTIGRFYKFISADDILEYYQGTKFFSGCCHICFDDGEKSIYNFAYPVLKTLNIPATLFVSPSILAEECNYWFQEIIKYDSHLIIKEVAKLKNIPSGKLLSYDVGEILKSLKIDEILSIKKNLRIKTGKHFNNYNISIAELRELQQSGIFTIGTHTFNHPILNNEDDEKAKQEIMGSVKQLEEILGSKVLYLAYPNGLPGLDYSDREIGYCRDANLKLAFSCEATYFSKDNNPYAIPRVEISRGNFLFIVSKILMLPWMKNRLENPKLKKMREKLKKLLLNA